MVLLADQCHGREVRKPAYKSREEYGGSAPKWQEDFEKPATLIIILPTLTEECDFGSCPGVVRSIQKNDMKNKKMADLAEK